MARLSRLRLGRALKDWVPALPFTLAAGGLLAFSALWLVRSSFAGIGGGWSLQAWRDVLGSELAVRAIKTSLGVSLWVASICTLVGSVLAWYVANFAARGRSSSQAILNVLSNFGGASLAIAMVSTLGAVGFVRLLLADWLGLTLPFDLYTPTGLVVTYVYFILPLFVLLVMPAMAAIRPEWWEAVQTSSGTRWDFWRRVGLPVLAPFLASGWVLTFTWAIGQFSVPYALLGEVSTVPLITTRMGDFLFSATGGSNRFQRAAALAVILVLVSSAALVVYRAASARMLRRLQGATR